MSTIVTSAKRGSDNVGDHFRMAAHQRSEGGRASCRGRANYSREAKFRVALDGYMAGYADHQQRCAGIIGGKTRHLGGGVGARLVVWLRNGSAFAKRQAEDHGVDHSP